MRKASGVVCRVFLVVCLSVRTVMNIESDCRVSEQGE
jgi:hypothetical protein